MNIEQLTIAEAREIVALFLGKNIPEIASLTTSKHPWELGKNYFIRTVTHHYTGRLFAVYPQEIVLEKAAWIADDGRLTDALAKSEFNEVEMYPDRPVIIGRGSILDAVEIKTIPCSQK